jgi:hypothetical protein
MLELKACREVRERGGAGEDERETEDVDVTEYFIISWFWRAL